MEASPIAKIIQMISDLQAKILAEGAQSQKVYEEFAEFCEHRSKDLQYEIKTGKDEKAELEATIAKEDAKSGALGEKIDELAGAIATDEGDLKKATEIREKEFADFSAEEKELLEVIDMIKRAIGILEREMAKSGAAMVQLKNSNSVVQALNVLVHAAALSAQDGTKLTALIQNSKQAEEEEEAGAPEAATYEGHSSGIIETLENLLEEAEGQLSEARKKETSSKNNYEMLKQSLEDDIANANKDLDEAKKSLAASGEAKATAQGDLTVTSKALAADISTLDDLHKDCLTKAQDFEAETKSRTEELKALAEAKKILKETTAGAEAQTYGLNQESFLQITSKAGLAQFEAVRLVRDLARKDNSRALAQLASRLEMTVRTGSAQGADPFAKVKGLISDMIASLEEAADADATEKAFCDKELAETRAKKDDKTAEIEKLSTKIDQMSTRSAKLKEEVAGLQKALADLMNAQAEMDKLRAEEAEAYKTNRAELEQGLEGVKLALKVLSDYYDSDASHNAAEGAGSSIIGLLEVAESDLEKELAEVIATEEMAAATYEKETKENTIDKAAKEQDVKYKTKEADELDAAVAEATADKTGVEAELAPVLKYLATLEDRCIAKAETYEEKKAKREAEIAGLKDALSILEGQSVFLQRKARRTKHTPLM
jgi:chromosome segregation ATPase